MTASGMHHGDHAPKAMAAPMANQQWATQAKPRQLERRLKHAHSSGWKKSSGLTRGAAAMRFGVESYFAIHRWRGPNQAMALA